MVALVRALEAVAQHQLFKAHKIKSWDVRPEQLPPPLQETCRTSYLEDIDGKYKLPLQAQFRVLAGLGDQLGQAFLREWPTMKPLLDAANHAVHFFDEQEALTQSASAFLAGGLLRGAPAIVIITPKRGESRRRSTTFAWALVDVSARNSSISFTVGGRPVRSSAASINDSASPVRPCRFSSRARICI